MTAKTGLDTLLELIAGAEPPPPLHATLGARLLEVSDGFAKLELLPSERLHGAAGTVHSGIASTLLDVVMAAAATTTLDALTSHTTVTLTVHITRSITARTTRIWAEGWVVHRGSRLVTTEGRLNDEHGRLLAHGSATFSLSDRAPPSA